MNVEVLHERFESLRRASPNAAKIVWAHQDPDSSRQYVVSSLLKTAATDSERRALTNELVVTSLAFNYEMGENGTHLFVMRPYLEGESLWDVVRRESPMRFDRALDLAASVTTELTRLHQMGMIHGGLNPKNVIVAPPEVERAHLPTVSLINGGPIFRSLFLTDTYSNDNAPYMPPEQTGLIRAEVGPRADLYSLGAILFALVDGNPPYKGKSLHELLQHFLRTDAHSIEFERPGIPEVFLEIVRRLLAKSPDDRYQTALGVLRDLEKLRAQISAGTESSVFAIGQQDLRTSLAQPVLVGRAQEVQTLIELAGQLKQGKGGLLTLEGASGLGKTRLLERWATEAKRLGINVYRGQAIQGADHQPLQALTEVASTAIAQAKTDRGFCEGFLNALGGDIATLAVMLPQMRGLSAGTAQGQLGPETFGVHRSQRAGALFLDSLGSTSVPAMVFLDDCQWADDLVLDTLEYWSRHGSARVLVVVAFRGEDTAAARRLHEMPAPHRLKLNPMSAEQLEELATSIAGPLPANALAWIHRLADGSPFFTDALLRGMVETGYLAKGPNGWVVTASKEGELRLTQQAATYFAHCVDLLPPHVKSFLAAGAVLGPRFSLALAGQVSRLEPSRLPWILKAVQERRMLWLDGDFARFVHDKIRETVLAGLSEAELKQNHGRAAEALATSEHSSAWALAYHYSRAGMYAEALPHALKAAEVARARFALDLAEQQLRIAATCCPPDRKDVHLRIHEGLGDVYMLRGNYAAAKQELDQAENLAVANQDRLRAWEKLGELHFKMGQMTVAKTYLENALKMLGQPIPGEGVRALWYALRKFTGLVMHSLFYRYLVANRQTPIPKEAAQTGRILNRLTYAYWFASGRAQCLGAQFASMILLEKYAVSAELAQAYSNHAPIMSMVGAFRRGEWYGLRSLEVREMLGDTWGKGQTQHFLGVLYYAAARYQDCVNVCRQAHAALLRTGDLWEVNISRYQVAASSYRLGMFQAARDLSEELYRRARETGDEQTAGIILDVWARVAPLDLPETYLQEALTHHWEDEQAYAQVRLAAACVALAKKDSQRAVQWLSEGIERVESKPISNGYVAPLYAWMLTALRQALADCPLSAGHRRKALKRQWRRRALAANIMSLRFPGERPRVLRERAARAAAEGKSGRALRLIYASLRWASKQGQAYEKTKSLFLLGCVLEDRGDAHGAQVKADATKALAEFEIKPHRAISLRPVASLSLLDLFDTLLRCGREIASALSIDEVFQNLQRSGHELFRGDRCVVLGEAVGSDKGVSILYGDSALVWNATIVNEAREIRSTVVRKTAVQQTVPGSAALEQFQMVLCAPVLALGEIRAYLYVTSSRLDAAFHEDATKISQLVCAVAGAAMENSILYQEKLKSNRLKDEFIATVSHELRTPMTAIKGWLDLLSSGAVTESELPSVHDALKRNVDAEMHLIDDLLDISRMSASQIRLFPETVYLADMVSGAVQTVLNSARQKQIEIEVDGQLEGVRVHCDPARLQQILWNLLANAVKFSNEGSQVQLSVRRTNQMIEFRIVDYGCGISPDFMPYLFEKFRQEDSSMRRTHAGLGLGLTIVKCLVDLHGGTIEAKSEGTNKGTTFIVRLPIEVT